MVGSEEPIFLDRSRWHLTRKIPEGFFQGWGTALGAMLPCSLILPEKGHFPRFSRSHALQSASVRGRELSRATSRSFFGPKTEEVSGCHPFLLIRRSGEEELRPSFSPARLLFHSFRRRDQRDLLRFGECFGHCFLRRGCKVRSIPGMGSRCCRNLCSICRGMRRPISL